MRDKSRDLIEKDGMEAVFCFPSIFKKEAPNVRMRHDADCASPSSNWAPEERGRVSSLSLF